MTSVFWNLPVGRFQNTEVYLSVKSICVTGLGIDDCVHIRVSVKWRPVCNVLQWVTVWYCWLPKRLLSCTNLAVIFCGFSLAERMASIIVVWQSCTVSVNSWAWLVIASSLIKSAKTERVRATQWLLVVSGEVELMELLIMLLDSQAYVLASSCDTTTIFIFLLTLFKLYNKTFSHFKVEVLLMFCPGITSRPS